MVKQIEINDIIPLPPCRHCGGIGEYKSAGKSFLNGYPLERLVCLKCTFETKKMAHGHREELEECWIKGVPVIITGTYTRKEYNKEEFYEKMGRYKKPQLRKEYLLAWTSGHKPPRTMYFKYVKNGWGCTEDRSKAAVFKSRDQAVRAWNVRHVNPEQYKDLWASGAIRVEFKKQPFLWI